MPTLLLRLVPLLSLAACASAAGVDRLVDAAATGANNGTTWPNAYAQLTTALAACSSGDRVFVAPGTYQPGTLRTDAFHIPSGVQVFGGCPQTTSPAARTPATVQQTQLNGDIGTVLTATDNVYHVVVFDVGTAPSVLDGFFVYGGYANGAAASDQIGGGIAMADANSAGSAAALVSIKNCILVSNYATGPGGGIACVNRALSLSYSVIEANTAAGVANGGGVYLFKDPAYTPAMSTDVRACLLLGNLAGAGGGIYAEGGQTVSVVNCTLYANHAIAGGSSAGGVHFASTTTPTMLNTILSSNTGASGYGDLYINTASPSAVTYSIVPGASSASLPGAGNVFTAPSFVSTSNLVGPDLVWATSDDGLVLATGSVGIDQGNATGASADGLAWNTTRPVGAGVDIGAYEGSAAPSGGGTGTSVTGSGTGGTYGTSVSGGGGCGLGGSASVILALTLLVVSRRSRRG